MIAGDDNDDGKSGHRAQLAFRYLLFAGWQPAYPAMRYPTRAMNTPPRLETPHHGLKHPTTA
ncbi:MAG: hypothetical protein IKP43_01350 [Bacteroidaceae bacterium]|nr:hypothetical protein [Bacteroidaceae bacterium]